MWHALDPNNIEDLNTPRTAKEIEITQKNSKKHYKTAMRKWNSKTGGGPGDPENYCDFEQQDPENFSRQDNQHSTLLTLTYIVDQQNGGALSGL